MVRRDELMPGIQYRIQGGARYTLHDIQGLIEDKARDYGISVKFRQDSISDNKLADLLGLMKTECTVLYHPDWRPNSVGFAMVLNTEGTYLFINLFGHTSSCRTNWAVIVEDIFKELFT